MKSGEWLRLYRLPVFLRRTYRSSRRKGLDRVERARRRRGLAVLGCLIWIVGFELLPNIHVGLHAHLSEHSHGSGSTARATTFAVQSHRDHRRRGREHSHHHGNGHGTHHGVNGAGHHDDQSGAPHAHGETSWSQSLVASALPLHSSPLEHGDHSLAHRDMAATTPLPVMTHPVPTTARLIPRDEVVEQAPRSRRLANPLARGPPYSAS